MNEELINALARLLASESKNMAEAAQYGCYEPMPYEEARAAILKTVAEAEPKS